MAAHIESCYEHGKRMETRSCGIETHPIRAGTWVDTRTIENRVGAALTMRIILPPIEIGKPAPGSRRLSPWDRQHLPRLLSSGSIPTRDTGLFNALTARKHFCTFVSLRRRVTAVFRKAPACVSPLDKDKGDHRSMKCLKLARAQRIHPVLRALAQVRDRNHHRTDLRPKAMAR